MQGAETMTKPRWVGIFQHYLYYLMKQAVDTVTPVEEKNAKNM